MPYLTIVPYLFSRRSLAFCALFILTSCAYALDGHIQDLTVVTPGASNAICYVYVDGLRYKFRPPQTINIFRSKEDLVVDCTAPGNRHKKVVIAPSISKHLATNAMVGAIPGIAWDYSSGAMFNYPDIVTVDFTYAQTKPMPLPAQNNPDVKQPEEYMLEEFLPASPRMNSDKYRVPVQIKRRQRPGQMIETYTDSNVFDGPASDSLLEPLPGKGDLSDVIDYMNPSADIVPVEVSQPSAPAPDLAPVVESQPLPVSNSEPVQDAPSSEPTQLYPGQ